MKIDKETFCEATKIKPDCWIFDNVRNPVFEYDDSPEFREMRNPVYRYDNGNGVIREFEVMEKYHETWMRTIVGSNKPGLWSTFKEW